MVQEVFQVAPWHCAQEMPVKPPARSCPWQTWQAARLRFAEAAWWVGEPQAIHEASWLAFTSKPPSRWPGAKASAGFTWQTAQSMASARVLAFTCAVWAPIATSSPVWLQVALGGAPLGS